MMVFSKICFSRLSGFPKSWKLASAIICDCRSFPELPPLNSPGHVLDVFGFKVSLCNHTRGFSFSSAWRSHEY